MKRPSNFLRTVSLESLQHLNKRTVISLFSGCGGMDLGVTQAGFEARVQIDNDRACVETLRLNFRKKPEQKFPRIIFQDIRKVSTRYILDAAELEVGECGLVTGGFPCQGFSMAGKRIVTDKRNYLYKECVRVVREALPFSFIFENVPGLVSMCKGRIIDKICRQLAACGYSVFWQTLNAADYGVPQDRIRVFFIGRRNDAAGIDYKTGKMRLHLGVSGGVCHPLWFEKRYKIHGTLPPNTQPAAKSYLGDNDRGLKGGA